MPVELTANGVRLHDEVSGKGPAVVLLHGNGADLHFFDALTALLEPRYTVYRQDSRRHGKSEKNQRDQLRFDGAGYSRLYPGAGPFPAHSFVFCPARGIPVI